MLPLLPSILLIITHYPMQVAKLYKIVQVKQHQAFAEQAFASIAPCALVTIIKVSGFDLQWSSAVVVTEFSATFKLQLDLPINFRFVFGWHDLFLSFPIATLLHTSEHQQQHQLERWSSSDQLALLQWLCFHSAFF